MVDYPGGRKDAALARCLRKRTALCRDVDQAVGLQLTAEDIEIRLTALCAAVTTISAADLARFHPALTDLITASTTDSSKFLGPTTHVGPLSEACHQ